MDTTAGGVLSVSRNFEDFYASEYPKVYRAALAFSGRREIALDSTQEAFARAFARWGRLSKETWAGGWAMTTALNLSRRALRKRPAADVSEGTVDASMTRIDVSRALRSLPEKQRQAVVLFYIGDHPLAVVAELMHLSEGTVKSHLARARTTLKEKLEALDA